MLLLPLIVLMVVAGHCVRAAELDLIVRDEFVNATDDKCGFCEERDGCRASRTFWIQGICRDRLLSAAIFDYIDDDDADNATKLCSQEFPGLKCQDEPNFTATTPDDCRRVWDVGACQNSWLTTVHRGWCVQSEQPVYPFVVPFFPLQIYRDVASCQNQTNFMTLTFLPADPGFCAYSAFSDGVNITYGSRKFICDDQDGTFISLKFVDQQCVVPTDKPARENGTTEECPTEEDNKELTYTAACSKATVHCKTLYETDLGFQDAIGVNPAPPQPTTAAPTPTTTTTAPTPTPSGSFQGGHSKYGMMVLVSVWLSVKLLVG